MSHDPVVYVVDADAEACRNIEAMARGRSMNARAFRRAGDFLAACPTDAPGCLILDLQLPDMDGLELLGVLKNQGRMVPVIITTACNHVPTVVRVMQSGVLAFLLKPCEVEILGPWVDTALVEDARRRKEAAEVAAILERIARLSARERWVLARVVEGWQNKRMAQTLNISIKAVEAHRSRMMKKMQADSLAGLVRMVLRASWRPEDEPPIPDRREDPMASGR